MKRFTHLLPALLAGAILVASSPAVFAQATDEKADEKKATAKKSEEKEDPLALPADTSSKSLFAFMAKVKRTRAEAGVERMDHLQAQVAAVIKAAETVIADKPDEKTEIRAIEEKIGALNAIARMIPKKGKAPFEEYMDALKADERPFIQSMMKARIFSDKIAAARAMNAEEQQEVIDELFEMIEKDGMTRTTYGLASSLGRSIGSPETGAAFYNKLADLLEASDEESLNSGASRARGAARRLGLPGNFMEVMGTTTDGKDFDWAKYRGKVVLVDFWASWCGPCRAEIPNMKKQLEAYGSKGFAIVGVNLDNTLAKCNEYVEKEELSWENLFTDEEGKRGWNTPLADYYGISGIPTAILVDKEGKVVSMSARGGNLNKLLKDLLGSPEETDSTDAAGE